VISPSQGRYLHTGQHKQYTDIHAFSGIRSHDPSVRASEDSSSVRPRGYCNRRVHHIEPAINKRKYSLPVPEGSQGSVVGIATGYGIDDCGVGVRVPLGQRTFSTSSIPTVGPTTAGIGNSFPVGKVSGSEADYSPATSTEVKKIWMHSPIRLHGVMLN
jgi:hypothetical protein